MLHLYAPPDGRELEGVRPGTLRKPGVEPARRSVQPGLQQAQSELLQRANKGHTCGHFLTWHRAGEPCRWTEQKARLLEATSQGGCEGHQPTVAR